MKLTRIKVENYRLLRNFTFDLENDLSLVVGKNNCGKTSMLSVLDKFINNGKFMYDDLSNYLKKELYGIITNNDIDFIENKELGISLLLFIEYDMTDDLTNIRHLMLDLDPKNKIVILQYKYILDRANYLLLKQEYEKYKLRHIELSSNEKNCFDIFINKNYSIYFKNVRFAVLYDMKKEKENLDKRVIIDSKIVDITRIINFKYIDAKRTANNKEKDKTLSVLSSEYYEKQLSRSEEYKEEKAINEFENTLIETDKKLTDIYEGLFENLLQKITKFGGMKKGDTIINIISNLKQKELLSGNTTVVYKDNNHILPENYNGLGYLNLISMIFEIESLLIDFRRENHKRKSPADINLLFIEEPEAHTHPQMQYIFIKNIKNILDEGSKGTGEHTQNHPFKLQTILTTHSSHIVSGSEFDDIKYFQKTSKDGVVSKNLRDLKIKYSKEKDQEFSNKSECKNEEQIVSSNHYKFLKQYLTLNYAEIFFADKAILIEGDTERILIPSMMKKIDTDKNDNESMPLLSQNISIIEVGAHSQIFDEFISFIGIKTLIITDIDFAVESIKEDGKKYYIKARPESGTHTSNGGLKHYYKHELTSYIKENSLQTQIDFFKLNSNTFKSLSKNENVWKFNNEGILLVVYQKEEGTCNDSKYCARSFEDSFIHLNYQFIKGNIETFSSLKPTKNLDNYQDSYDIASTCINKKTSFAMDILLHSNERYDNWEIPAYIKEGLLWIQKD